MRRISRKNRAFTLVEILIVVVILGILAAIVVPQFAKAADDARAGNIATQLSTLQNAVELYRAREGQYPDLSNDWQDLTADSDNDLIPDIDADGDGNIDTAYIKAPPANPFVPSTAGFADDTVTESNAAGVTGSAAAAWLWNTAEQRMYASYYREDSNDVAPVPVATD